MDKLSSEIEMIIFGYCRHPRSLCLTNRKWYKVSKDPHARAHWLIAHYGKARALFHAVRLGELIIGVFCLNRANY